MFYRLLKNYYKTFTKLFPYSFVTVRHYYMKNIIIKIIFQCIIVETCISILAPVGRMFILTGTMVV